MNRVSILILSILLLTLVTGSASTNDALAQLSGPQSSDAAINAAFTYQGRLVDAGVPANGSYDLRFILYNADVNGSQVGNPLTFEDVAVNQGLFTVILNFGAVFDGSALWLEVGVRPGTSTGAFTTLSPRQSLTAAPYSAYSLRAPWGGLSGVPAGFSDGVDDNTTYSAGSGLVLMGNGQFQVSFGGSGAAGTVARSDHNHLGQTWSGSDNAFKIIGSFNTASSPAPLVLNNQTGHGLQIDSTGKNGVYVASAGWDGVRIDTADSGISVGTATYYGLSVSSAGWAGILVNSTQGDGIHVNSADHTGVAVAAAGQYGVWAGSTNSAYEGGHFENSAAGGAGLFAVGGSDSSSDLVLGASSASNDNGLIQSDPRYTSSDIVLTSNDTIQLNLDEDNNESGNFWILNGTNATIFSLNESGDMYASGTKSAVVSTQDYGQLKLYAMESPQNWFEDFGSSQLINGSVKVKIDPVFAETINLNEAYYVFLTPLGDCPLFIAEKTAQDFTVTAMGGQACSIAFDYRIIAKRLGYENLRLEPAEDMAGDQ